MPGYHGEGLAQKLPSVKLDDFETSVLDRRVLRGACAPTAVARQESVPLSAPIAHLMRIAKYATTSRTSLFEVHQVMP